MDVIHLLIILSGLYVGFNIGSNDAANCIGTSVGSGVIGYKKGALLVGILAFIGATLQGSAPMQTVGKGIVDAGSISDVPVITALLSAGLIVTVFTLLGMPVSSTQAIIGTVAGTGISIAASVNWNVFFTIFLWGFGGFFFSMLLSFIFYIVLGKLFTKGRFLAVERNMGILVLFSGMFLAYSLGANNIGNAMGLVVGKGIMGPYEAGFLGGLALLVGSSTLGRRVIKTIGSGIVEMTPIMAFSSQLSAALVVYILALIGIPTSTTFTIVGGIAGTGLVKGIAAVNKKTMRNIISSWVVITGISIIFSFLIYRFFLLFNIT